MSGTEQKQTYLRQQIIDQGYNAQDFFEYLVQKRPDGADIDKWTMDQLKQLVQGYKKKATLVGLNSKISETEAEPAPLPKNMEVIGEKEINKIMEEKDRRVEYEKYNLYDNAILREIDGISFRRFLNDEHSRPDIIVQKPEVKVNPGLFFGIGRSAQLWYVVRSNIVPDVWVKRSDNDMDWLKNIFLKLYPGYVIPPFNKFSGDLQKEQKKSLQKRAKMCHYFLNALAHFELFFNTKLFVGFVSLTDYNKFTDLKKQYDRIQSPQKVSQMPTLKGKVPLELTSRIRSSLRAIDKYTNSIDPIFEKLDNQCRNIGRDMDRSAETLLKIGNHFAQLQQNYSGMVNFAPSCRIDGLSDSFITLNNIFYGWGKLLQQNRKLLNDHLGVLFRYCRQENQNYCNFLTRRQQIEQEYLRIKADLFQKKSKMYVDPAKWDINPQFLKKISGNPMYDRDQVMDQLMPRETQQQQGLRDRLSFLNSCSERQFQRLSGELISRMGDAFGKVGEHLVGNGKQQLQMLLRMREMLGVSMRKEEPVAKK